MKKITVEVSDTVFDLLQVLTHAFPRPNRSEVPPATVEDVVHSLIDHAQQGVYRPGAWERGWLEQAFGDDWQQFLERGDPHGRPGCEHLFQRPKK